MSVKSVRVPLFRNTLPEECTEKSEHSEVSQAARKALGHYSRVPSEVTTDPILSHRDKAVYAALALFERKGTANTGIRYMAEASHIRLDSFCVGLRHLAERGHISQEINLKRGRRQTYRMKAAMFATIRRGKSVAPSATVLEPPEDKPKVTCPRCHKSCHGLMKIGWCRSCGWDLKVRRIAREEISATA